MAGICILLAAIFCALLWLTHNLEKMGTVLCSLIYITEALERIAPPEPCATDDPPSTA